MRAHERLLEEKHSSFVSKLEDAVTERTGLQQSLERVTLERDRLLRQNKKFRASFLCRADEENLNMLSQESPDKRTVTESKITAAADEARSDYRTGDVDLRAEQKRSDFVSRVGSRLGSVKYADWLKFQNEGSEQ